MTTDQANDTLWGKALAILGEDYIRDKLAERDRAKHGRRIAARLAANGSTKADH